MIHTYYIKSLCYDLKKRRSIFPYYMTKMKGFADHVIREKEKNDGFQNGT